MIRIGVLCPSEIAFRRFLPALCKNKNFEYVGVAIANKVEWCGAQHAKNFEDEVFNKIQTNEKLKAENFQKNYGGKLFLGYEEMLYSKEIDAVYIPLPPALHYQWAKMALENHIHVLVEKPATTSLEETKKLINLAKDKNLALHENYMFMFHSQIREIDQVIKHGNIGDIRLFRIDFGFPERAPNDFRYNKALGGGALIDCGGYTLKYANYLLGGNAKIICANSLYTNKYDVDIAGSATLKNENGQIAQVSFGMDNDYRCSIDIWGSKGTLKSGRILTAPDGFEPSYDISNNGETQHYQMSADDSFSKSLQYFNDCINNEVIRIQSYENIHHQGQLVQDFINLASQDMSKPII